MTEELKIEPEKFKLKKDFEEKLKIYFLFVKDDSTMPHGQIIGAIVAYRPEDALTKARQDYPNKNIFWQGQFVTIEDLLKMLYSEEGIITIKIEPKEISFQKEKILPQKLNKEQFIQGLSLAIDEFVKEKEDQNKLREILKKI